MSTSSGARHGRREIAGRLSERVQVVGVVRIPDDQGGHVDRPRLLGAGPVPAEVVSAPVEERVAAAGVAGAYTHRVTIRWMPDITERVRLQWGGRTLEVTGPPVEIGRRWLLELTARERVAPL